MNSYFILHELGVARPVQGFNTIEDVSQFLRKKYDRLGAAPFARYTVVQYEDGFPTNSLSADQLLTWLLSGGRR